MGVATLYGIRNCDTVKKARAWLEEHGVDYQFHDYKLSGIELERLNRWCTELGWEVLLNRSGTTFRKLPEARKHNLDTDRAMALMASQPSVIKRPVVELSDRLVVGFKPELYQSLKW
jgi:arsenate reductase